MSRLCAVISAMFLFALTLTRADAAPLFEQSSVLDVELSGPISSLIDGDPEARTQLPFSLETEGVRHDIKVRLRGNSRLRVCKFPPLRLNFAGDQVEGTVFEGQDKLKLVTHCRNYDDAEQDLLLEYLAYRIFNRLSDISYRVRLLRFTYNDTDGALDADARHRYGFVIESSTGLAARTGAQEIELTGVSRNSIDADQAALVYIFQYLIANTDWSIVRADGDEYCCHNIDLFKIDNVPFLVPYDFDLAGLVNTRYAKPDPSLRIRRVTKRLYRGYCVRPDALRSALRKIVALRSEILAMPAELPGVTPKTAKTAAGYLAQFFARAEDEQKILNSFEQSCL